METKSIVGISRPTFLTLGTYMFVIVFYSTTVFTAIHGMISLLVVQSLSFLLLPLIARRVNSLALPWLSAALISACASGLFLLLGLPGIPDFLRSNQLSFAPLYLLILMPLLVHQAKNPKEYKISRAVIHFVLYAACLFVVAGFREVLGWGQFLGERIISQGDEPMPLFTHTAGGAFLLLILMLIILFFYRQITCRRFVLADLEQSPLVGEGQEEQLNSNRPIFELPVMVLILLQLSMIIMYFILTVLSSIELMLPMIMLLAVSCQGLWALALWLVMGRKSQGFNELLSTGWILALQTVVLSLPYVLFWPKLLAEQGHLYAFIIMIIYIVGAWLLITFVWFFLQALKRKLLFGKPPQIMTGLPFILLLTGLCSLVVLGFSDVWIKLLSLIVP